MPQTSTRQALDELFDVVFRDRIPRSPQFGVTPTAARQLGLFSDEFDRSEPISLVETISAPTKTDDWTLWRTNKMKYARSDRSAIRFNDYIELSAIPEHAHNRPPRTAHARRLGLGSVSARQGSKLRTHDFRPQRHQSPPRILKAGRRFPRYDNCGKL